MEQLSDDKSDVYSYILFGPWQILAMLSEDFAPSFLVDKMISSKIV
jgi:hypothetical protein